MNEFKFLPTFIEAKTKKLLVKVMMDKCLRDGVSYRFFDIQYDVKENVWVAWYYPEKDNIK